MNKHIKFFATTVFLTSIAIGGCASPNISSQNNPTSSGLRGANSTHSDIDTSPETDLNLPPNIPQNNATRPTSPLPTTNAPEQVEIKKPTILTIGLVPRSRSRSGSENPGLNQVDILDQDQLVVAGEDGIAWYSKDRGKTWEARHFSGEGVYSLTNRGDDLIAGKSGGIFIWNADEAKWDLLSADISDRVYHLNFFDNQNGFAIGGYANTRLYQTTDGGKSWEAVQEIPTSANGPAAAKITITDKQSKQAAILTDNRIYTYDDGSLKQTSAIVGWAGDIAFKDSLFGFIYGAGQNYLTQDGGKTYNQLESMTVDGKRIPLAQIRALSFASPQHGVLISGPDGMTSAYFTQDGGESWESLDLPETQIGSITSLKLFLGKDELIGIGRGPSDKERDYSFYQIKIPLS